MASDMRASSEFSVESAMDAIPSPPKRKGGRKPTFTAEARRQRNRDAQAAFRERRTEYIKELEQTVKIYGDKLRGLEAARANAADECLMLRYKNSLLERMLLYKGVDVRAELKSEFWNPGAAPTRSRIPSEPQRDKSLKRKANAGVTLQDTRPAKMLISAQEPQYLSPASNSPETSEPSTPPSMAPPTPTHTQSYHPSKPASYIPITSFRREDHRKVFPPIAAYPSKESNPSPGYRLQEKHVDAFSVPETASMADLLENGDNPYSLGSLDDFDFTTDYLAMTPLSFSTLSS